MVPKRAPEEPRKLDFASPRPWKTLPREVLMDLGRTQKYDGETVESPVDGHDQPKIYIIRDHTLEVLMHPSVLELHAVRVVHTPQATNGNCTRKWECGVERKRGLRMYWWIRVPR